jgi:hypothetical protein
VQQVPFVAATRVAKSSIAVRSNQSLQQSVRLLGLVVFVFVAIRAHHHDKANKKTERI